MRMETTARLVARATSGQRLDIRYDPATNAITFIADDWSADGRGVATSRSAFREQIAPPRLRLVKRRSS